MTLDASGNLGLGATTTAGGRLVITQNNATQPAIYLPTDESTIQGPSANTKILMGGNLTVQSANVTTISAKNASGYIVFATDATPTERMRITSAGNVGIGTSSPSANLDIVVGTGSAKIKVGDGTVSGGAYINLQGASGAKTWFVASNYNVGGALEFTQSTANGGSTIAGTASMLLDSSGNLGLGVTPSAWGTSSVVFKSIELGVVGSGISGLSSPAIPDTEITTNAYYNSGWKYAVSGYPSLRASLNGDTAGAFSWNIAPSGTAGGAISFTQAMTLDASGNLGVGTTSPTSFGGFKTLELANSSGNAISLVTGTSVIAQTIASNTNSLVYTGTRSNHSLVITTNDTERMRIDTSGRLLVGTTSTTCGGNTISANGVNIVVSANYAVGITTPVGDQYAMLFANGTNGIVGSIYLTSVATAYNVTSDQRLKTNIVDAPSGNIDSIKVRSFDWIANGSHQEYGMVAQELIEVAPYAVTKTENPDDMMQVDYSKLVPMMIREIQDLKAEVNQLKAKIGV
jgi:hypothetical protein